VRQALGTHFRVPADLPTAEFVAELARQRPEAVVLAEPLARLEGPMPGQAALLRQLRRLDDEVRRLLGRAGGAELPALPDQEAAD
jgi:hypothetical protein